MTTPSPCGFWGGSASTISSSSHTLMCVLKQLIFQQCKFAKPLSRHQVSASGSQTIHGAKMGLHERSLLQPCLCMLANLFIKV